mgnify:CR=1 FL=1
MIVVLILAISAALAVPRIGETSATRLSAAARQLVADLAFAQVESIAHSDDLRVIVFDTTLQQYHIAAASDTATPITNPITKFPYIVKFGQGSASQLTNVTIGTLGVGGDDQLQFGAYGQLDQGAAATIQLVCEGKTIVITIYPSTGEATLCSVN